MAEPIFLLLGTPGGWRMMGGAGDGADDYPADLGLPVDARADEAAAKASELLEKNAYGGQGIVLALPSAWCFAASIRVADLPRNDRKAMVYRLEEKLPVAAEAVVADFLVRPGGEALGVCARIEPVSVLIESLEGRGVEVQCVAPAALLAAEGVAGEASDEPVVLLMSDAIFDEGLVEVVMLQAGQPTHWATIPAHGADVRLHLDMLSMSLPAPPKVVGVGLAPEVGEALSGFSPELKSRGRDLIESTLEVAAEVLGGRRKPWFEFRRGALAAGDRLRLYRKPLNAALAAGLVMMLGLLAAMFVRERRYVAAEAASSQQLADAFREQFPGWEVPANLRAVIDSEYRKAAMADAAQGVGAGIPRRSAVETFKSVLSQLPTQENLSIRKMTFEDSAFELEGRVKSYELLDGIVAAARKAGMEVPAPESRKNGEGYWEFTLRGALAATGGRGPGEVAKGGGE